MNEKKKLDELLKELMAAKGLSVAKLASSSNIPSRFIDLLIEGRYNQLPSKPYIRGYLIKIASILGIEPEALLESYNSSVELSSSGKMDKLPINRFAFKPINRGLIVGIIIIAIIVGIIVFRFKDIMGIPTIQVNVPTTTQTQTLSVTGYVKPGDSVTLNNENVYPASDGTFEKDVLLSPGLNTLQFNVKRFLGEETNLIKYVSYDVQTTSTKKSTSISTQTSIQTSTSTRQ